MAISKASVLGTLALVACALALCATLLPIATLAHPQAVSRMSAQAVVYRKSPHRQAEVSAAPTFSTSLSSPSRHHHDPRRQADVSPAPTFSTSLSSPNRRRHHHRRRRHHHHHHRRPWRWSDIRAPAARVVHVPARTVRLDDLPVDALALEASALQPDDELAAALSCRSLHAAVACAR
jgi:hypothetical protein